MRKRGRKDGVTESKCKEDKKGKREQGREGGKMGEQKV